MATTTKTGSKTGTKSTGSTQKTATAKAAVKTETPAKVETTKETVFDIPVVPKQIDVNQYVPVKNGFHGVLVFKSPHTGETFEWGEFGDIQDIQLTDLRAAKNSMKGFFINNWFLFDEEYDWVIDYLGVRKYYANALGIDDFDGLLDKSASEIEKIINALSEGQKKSVAYMVGEKIRSGEIDSRKLIASLEKTLGVSLIES